MTVKEYLEEYLYLCNNIDEMCERRNLYNGQTMNLSNSTYSSIGGRSQHSNAGTASLEKAVDALMNLEDVLFDKIILMCDMRVKIEIYINDYCDTETRAMIRWRYINNLTFDKIAVKMDYCLRNVMRIHKITMEKLSKFNTD